MLVSRRFANKKLLNQFESNIVKVFEAHNDYVDEEHKITPEIFRSLYGIDENKKSKSQVQQMCVEVSGLQLIRDVVIVVVICYYMFFHSYYYIRFYSYYYIVVIHSCITHNDINTCFYNYFVFTE